MIEAIADPKVNDGDVFSADLRHVEAIVTLRATIRRYGLVMAEAAQAARRPGPAQPARLAMRFATARLAGALRTAARARGFAPPVSLCTLAVSSSTRLPSA